MFRKLFKTVLGSSLALTQAAEGCTGITLKAQDGSVLYGRTMEWGTFDLNSRIIVLPRGMEFTGATPDGRDGLKWKAKYGVVGLDGLSKDLILDGMNEKGLAVGVFYHPDFAEYNTYIPEQAARTLGPSDVAQFLLTQFASVDEVRAAMASVRVVPVVEPALGFAPPVHFIVTEPSGKSIVIEFLKGELTIFDNPLGVLTNAPSFDWHMTNLRNYINLSPVALPGKEIDKIDFKPLGGGSGMIGLPGDFTPPSRFVRAVAWSSTARKTPDGPETSYEVFRILDNFNVPAGASEGFGTGHDTAGLRSSTLWTTACDTKNLTLYYHTQHNRRVRMIDVKALDFDRIKEIMHAPLDKEKRQDIDDITPGLKERTRQSAR
jgi:choloylglycine hydrolase